MNNSQRVGLTVEAVNGLSEAETSLPQIFLPSWVHESDGLFGTSLKSKSLGRENKTDLSAKFNLKPFASSIA